MSGLKCLACVYESFDAEDFRAHHKSDWHRHNLKRRVANLPPFSAEFYKNSVLAQKAQAEEKEKDSSVFCEACNKRFKTKNAFENHLPSRHHKDAEAALERRQERETRQKNRKNQEKGIDEEPESSPALKDLKSKTRNVPASKDAMEVDEEEGSDAESWESWEDEALTVAQCLFCPVDSGSLEGNMEHMAARHCLFLPDADFLVDLTEFIEYLGEKVGVGHLCLWCGEKGKRFHSVDAVQKHMRDKNHCRILFEGDAALEYSDFYDYRKSYPDDPHGAEEDKMVPVNELESDGYELRLPSGATVGHRSLMRFYKQNAHVCQRNQEVNRSMLPKLLAKYRALGWTGATGERAVRLRQDLGYMQRLRHHQHLHVGLKANKLQRYFRNQNPI